MCKRFFAQSNPLAWGGGGFDEKAVLVAEEDDEGVGSNWRPESDCSCTGKETSELESS